MIIVERGTRTKRERRFLSKFFNFYTFKMARQYCCHPFLFYRRSLFPPDHVDERFSFRTEIESKSR